MENVYIDFATTVAPFSIHHATIKSEEISFTWKVDLKAFETIHGLSRVLLLLPDKLKTAMELSKESPQTDGTFMIELVLDLLQDYENKSYRCAVPSFNQPLCEVHTCALRLRDYKLFRDAVHPNYTLSTSITLLIDCLKEMKSTLQARSYQLYEDQITAIFRIMDIIHIYTEIYLRFVHPCIIEANRDRSLRAIGLQQKINHLQLILINLPRYRNEQSQ